MKVKSQKSKVKSCRDDPMGRLYIDENSNVASVQKSKVVETTRWGVSPGILTTNQSVRNNKKDYYVTQYLSSALLAVPVR